MKKKQFHNGVVVAIVIATLVALAWTVYTWLEPDGRQKEQIDLYSFVPEGAIAIWEAPSVHEFVGEINRPSFRHKFDSLHISSLLDKIFENMKDMSDVGAHGISRQLSSILLSFHYPNTTKDQVLYCLLDTDDRQFIEGHIKQRASSDFPPKKIEYKGEHIIIYPLGQDEFLACFYHSGLIAISHQSYLIEQVIDAYLSKECSILSDTLFAKAQQTDIHLSGSSIYLRAWGFPFDTRDYKYSSTAPWVKFRYKMNRDAIYLSGIAFEPDSCNSFISMLKHQKPVEVVKTEYLPESTFYINQLSLSDISKAMHRINKKNDRYSPGKEKESVERKDSCILEFLKENVDSQLCNFTFYNQNNRKELFSIANIQLKECATAEKKLQELRIGWAKETGEQKYMRPNNYLFSNGTTYLIYELPQLKIFDTITGNSITPQGYYGCFYQNQLLISPQETGIYAYIEMINQGKTKKQDAVYQECISGLSAESSHLILTDLEHINTYSSFFEHLMPSILMNNKEFFNNFIFATQFTHSNGYVSPNITLIYKGEKSPLAFIH